MAQLSERMRGLVQPYLAGIEPYDPKFTPTRVNLSANENTWPVPDGVREKIDAALRDVPLNRYPEPMPAALRDELAAWHGVARDQVCVGNGGDELLYNFLLAFGGEGRVLVTCPPDFAEYAFFASLTRTEVRRVWRDPETMRPDLPALEAAAREADLVIVTSPNNPTGDLLDAGSVRRLCAACRGMVMVDEAYVEFAGPGASVTGLLGELPNLVVLRTLSKAFGLAGARCGYVLAAPDVIEVFGAIRQIYSVNVLTQAAALTAVRERAAYLAQVPLIAAERDRLKAGLDELAATGRPIATWSSAANFLLVRVPGASELRRRLRDERSILVRDFSYAPGLSDCLRITAGTPEENDQVLAAMADLVGKEA